MASATPSPGLRARAKTQNDRGRRCPSPHSRCPSAVRRVGQAHPLALRRRALWLGCDWCSGTPAAGAPAMLRRARVLTKDSRGSGRELRLEAIIRSEGLVHLLGQVASRRAARLRSHRAPQEAVVVVAAARVVDLVLLGVGHQRDKRGGRLASHRLVQVSDVRLRRAPGRTGRDTGFSPGGWGAARARGLLACSCAVPRRRRWHLVVEVVVELHGGCIDVGLERILRVPTQSYAH